MFEPKHTVTTVVATMFAVVLAMFSLTLPWYEVTEGWVDDGLNVHHNTSRFYLSHYIGDDGMRDYDYDYPEVGGLLSLTSMLILIWALVAIAYVGRLLVRDEGFVRWWEGGFVSGWVLMAVSLMPVLVFALFVAGAYNADRSEYIGPSPVDSFIGYTARDDWGPLSGWLILLVAWLVQVVAILARNLPAILYRLKGPDKLPPEMETRGDLPVR
jgi:hypothetical protein